MPRRRPPQQPRRLRRTRPRRPPTPRRTLPRRPPTLRRTPEHVETKEARMSHQAARRAGPAYWISRAVILFVYGFAITCIVILAMAFFLQLFNANTTAPFVDWVYRAARRIMQPFRGIFPSVEGEQGSVFDVSMLFAMFMYGLLALGLQALIAWIDRKIASIRYEARWRPATRPAMGP